MKYKEAELDITAFMNLMIVLVPVLLLNMTFSYIRVVDLALPELSDRIEAQQDESHELQLVLTDQSVVVEYPAGEALKSIALQNGEFNHIELQDYLKQVKATLRAKDQDRTSITLLVQPGTSYQTVVSLMDTVKSYPTVVAASVVQASLFPDISLGDSPAVLSNTTLSAGQVAVLWEKGHE